jgi:hypothetical protein
VTFLELQHEIEDLVPTLGVQVTGGLVREQQWGLQQQGTAKGHTLPLTTRQLVRVVVHALLQTYLCQ